MEYKKSMATILLRLCIVEFAQYTIQKVICKKINKLDSIIQ